jgi:hypothetical protein
VAQQGLSSASAQDSRGAFVDELIERTDAALAATDVVQRDYRIAGRTVRLRFAGDALVAPVTAALAHAEIEDGDPELIADIWDSETSGQPRLRPGWTSDAYIRHGAIAGFFDDELQVHYTHGSGAITVMLPDRQRAVYWLAGADRFPDVERGSPLRTLLHLWLSRCGLQLQHSAALGDPDGCALVVGAGGSGKSSVALACLDSDLGHLADDYCVLEPGAPPRVHALYSSVKVRADTVKRLGIDPALIANPGRPPEDKAIVFLAEHRPERLVAAAPVKAIAVPVITGRTETGVRPISGARALRELAPSTIFQLPGQGEEAVRSMADVVRAIPSYALEVGTDPGQVAGALRELIER